MQTKKHHLPWDTKHGWVKTFGLVMHVRGCIKQRSLLHLLIAMQRELWPSKCAAFLKHPNNCAACLLPTKNLQATPRGGVLACLLLLCAQIRASSEPSKKLLSIGARDYCCFIISLSLLMSADNGRPYKIHLLSVERANFA